MTNRNPERIAKVRSRSSIPPPERPRDLEPPVLEEEGAVVAVLVHAPHLHALHPPLERRVRDRLQAQVHDPVGEELLLQGGRSDVEARFLRDQEARDPEVPQPFEESEGLRAPVPELEDQLEGVPRIDREELEVAPSTELEDLRLQDRHESF